MLADLTRYGRVKRPALGIESYAIGPDLAEQVCPRRLPIAALIKEATELLA